MRDKTRHPSATSSSDIVVPPEPFDRLIGHLGEAKSIATGLRLAMTEKLIEMTLLELSNIALENKHRATEN